MKTEFYEPPPLSLDYFSYSFIISFFSSSSLVNIMYQFLEMEKNRDYEDERVIEMICYLIEAACELEDRQDECSLSFSQCSCMYFL